MGDNIVFFIIYLVTKCDRRVKLKNDNKILKYVFLGINIIMLIITIIWFILVNNKVNIVEDYRVLVAVLIFLLCVSFILLLIKKKWTFILGIIILLLSSIGGFQK